MRPRLRLVRFGYTSTTFLRLSAHRYEKGDFPSGESCRTPRSFIRAVQEDTFGYFRIRRSVQPYDWAGRNVCSGAATGFSMHSSAPLRRSLRSYRPLTFRFHRKRQSEEAVNAF